MAKGVLDIYLIYEFLRRLVTPFEKWDAYKAGVIDKDGKVILNKASRTPAQEKTWGYYDKLLANLKKLLGKIPGGKTRIASFAAALLLLKEKNLDPDDLEYLEECIEHYMVEAKTLIEEVPVNNVGGGAISGIIPGEDPPVKKKPKIMRRKKVKV